MSHKPSIPKGTRDFSPTEMTRRNYIFDTIKKVYKRYGFQQIETPAMENMETLVGTGGEESDQLIFKILKRGEKLKKNLESLKTHIPNSGVWEDEKMQNPNNAFENSFAEEALRYDLTVPFARYVVQNQNDIAFPFRRFQIQPVWRADKPQKGRYREFYQCDADIIGSDSLLNEVDLIKIIDDVFSELFKNKDGEILPYTISINNRKILQGIVKHFNAEDKFESIVVAIDKLDKIGMQGVVKELEAIGLENLALKIISLIYSNEFLETEKRKNPNNQLAQSIGMLKWFEDNVEATEEGVNELIVVFETLKKIGLKTDSIKFDATLARGLGYYTGTIIEVKVDDFPSICGGGRYDDLTGKFGLKDSSGVGISFGADRIYDVLLDNNLFPEFKRDSTEVLFTNQKGSDEEIFLPMLFELRAAGINSEIYPDEVKWKRQMNFAERKNIKFIVSANEDGDLFVKNMENEAKTAFSSAKELISLIQQ